MPDVGTWLLSTPLDSMVVRLAVALALGLFLGLEREWSQKPAGIRTFALVSVLGTIFTLYDAANCGAGADCLPLLSVVGGLFATVLAGGLVAGGVVTDEGLNLTTAVSVLVAYGVGLLVGIGEVLPATVVAVTSSLLLVLKRELHGFAWGLTHAELRSVSEFAILAFVVYPLLPSDPVALGPGGVTVEPRVVWLMVVFVAGLGLVNYVIATSYGGRGIAVTGFFGGLASSTAVVGAMRDHLDGRPEATGYGVAAVLLANAAMALRNLVIALVFTASVAPLSGVLLPLGVAVVGSVAVAARTADWGVDLEMELDSPFSLRNALGFGALFLAVVVASSVAGAEFGRLGFYATTAVAGLVSSAGAVTSAVVLYRTGSLPPDAAVIAVTLATLSSVAVKAGLAATSPNREFARRTVRWSVVLGVAVGAAGAVAVL